jgi:hypothetical protein
MCVSCIRFHWRKDNAPGIVRTGAQFLIRQGRRKTAGRSPLCRLWNVDYAFVAQLVKTAADVRIVLQTNHQSGARERVEHRVALRRIQPADFHGPADAHFVARAHREQERLQFVEACVEHERSLNRRSCLHKPLGGGASDVPLDCLRDRPVCGARPSPFVTAREKSTFGWRD